MCHGITSIPFLFCFYQFKHCENLFTEVDGNDSFIMQCYSIFLPLNFFLPLSELYTKSHRVVYQMLFSQLASQWSPLEIFLVNTWLKKRFDLYSVIRITHFDSFFCLYNFTFYGNASRDSGWMRGVLDMVGVFYKVGKEHLSRAFSSPSLFPEITAFTSPRNL